MTPGRNLKAIIGLAVGIGVFSALFLWWSLDSVLGHLAAAGFALLWVCVFALPEQMLGAEAWRRLFPSGNRPRYRDTLLASWMGSAINTFLPVATIGGEIAKARILHLWGRPGAETAATMIIEKTVQAVAVLLWSLVGVGCLAFTVRDGDTVAGLLVGAGVLFLGIAGFVVVQVRGGFSWMAEWAIRRSGGRGASLVENAAEMDASIREIYGHPSRLLAGVGCRLAQRLILAGEVVLAGALMGVPIGLIEAVILKGINAAFRGMSFAVPAGIGIQEGGFVAVGALLGHPPELMIAVSLATRVREMLPNVPFLVLWQGVEGRFAWRRRAEGSGEAE